MRSRFLAMPTSTLGRITAALAAAVLVAVVLMATVVEPSQPTWRASFGVFIVALVLATSVMGVVAILLKRERSWAVIVPTMLCLAVAVNEVVQQLGAS